MNDDDRVGCPDSVRLSPATVVTQWLAWVLTVRSWAPAWELMTEDLRVDCVRRWVAAQLAAAGVSWIPGPDPTVDAMASSVDPRHPDWRRFSQWMLDACRESFGPIEELGIKPDEEPIDPAHEIVHIDRISPHAVPGMSWRAEWAVVVEHTEDGPRIASFGGALGQA